MVPWIKNMGARVLLNESVVIRRDDVEMWIAGVDDNHYYQCADIPRAFGDAPDEGFRILLVHSPESVAEACAAGCDLYLAGHTHGGQICLPFGIPVIRNARCPREFLSGSWQSGNLRGYTSRGTGSSGIPARLFCPPEITIHELVRTGARVEDRVEEAATVEV
jgi:predicted MPP superfamily phosphohydrolase